MKDANGCLMGYLILSFLGALAIIAAFIWAFRPALDLAGW